MDKKTWRKAAKGKATNNYSTGTYIPYVVEFHFPDGTVERIES